MRFSSIKVEDKVWFASTLISYLEISFRHFSIALLLINYFIISLALFESVTNVKSIPIYINIIKKNRTFILAPNIH